MEGFKKGGFRKGQMTPVNLMIYVVSFVIMFVMLPVITSITEATLVPALANSTNPNATLILTIANLVPAVFIFALLVSMISMAVPRQPGY
jgi:hypothetical protein